MKDKMFKRLTSATLSIVMALSMYTCRAEDSGSEQVAGNSTIQSAVIESKDSEKPGVLKWILGAACAIPVIGVAVRHFAHDAQRTRDEQAAAAQRTRDEQAAAAQRIRDEQAAAAQRIRDEQAAADATAAAAVLAPKPVAPVPAADAQSRSEEAFKILENHGYNPTRHRAENRIYSDGEGEHDTRPLDGSNTPIVLSDDEFRYVINNVEGEVVYRGVYSGRGKHSGRGDTEGRITYKQDEPESMDLGRYQQSLFHTGVLSSQPSGGDAKGLRCEGQGLYFSSSFRTALHFALGHQSRWFAANYKGGLVFQGFLIGSDVKPGNLICIQSNARLVLRETPFKLDQDVNKIRSALSKFGLDLDPDNLAIKNKLIVQKYKEQFQRWNIVKQQ